MRHPNGPQSDEEKNWQIKFDKDQICKMATEPNKQQNLNL